MEKFHSTLNKIRSNIDKNGVEADLCSIWFIPDFEEANDLRQCVMVLERMGNVVDVFGREKTLNLIREEMLLWGCYKS